jgi:hypothetical protein
VPRPAGSTSDPAEVGADFRFVPKHDPSDLLGTLRAASGIVRHLGLFAGLDPVPGPACAIPWLWFAKRDPNPTFSADRFHRKRCTWSADPATNLLILNPFPRSPSLG